MVKTLYIITGPPGSGKTTRAKELKKEQGIICHYEADMWMEDFDGNYCFDPKKLGFCHRKCQEKTLEAMKKGFDVIVSNTTLTKKEAFPYIDLAKEFGYDIQIIHLEPVYQNVHGVSKEKIQMMKDKREYFKLQDFNENTI